MQPFDFSNVLLICLDIYHKKETLLHFFLISEDEDSIFHAFVTPFAHVTHVHLPYIFLCIIFTGVLLDKKNTRVARCSKMFLTHVSCV